MTIKANLKDMLASFFYFPHAWRNGMSSSLILPLINGVVHIGQNL
jgi:hypothetical protein